MLYSFANADNLSPHLPLVCHFSIDLPLSAPITDTAAQVNVARYALDWSCKLRNDNYCSLVSSRLKFYSSSSLDMIDADITSTLIWAARKSGCSKVMRLPKPGWSLCTTLARNRSRFWHKIWIDSGRLTNSAVYSAYCSARRVYRNERTSASKAALNKEASLLTSFKKDGKIRSFWKRIAKARRDGSRANSKLSASDFRDHFEAVHDDTLSSLSVDQLDIAHRVKQRAKFLENTPSFAKIISSSDVALLLPRLKRNTARGPDGICTEHIFFGSCPELLNLLAQLLTLCMNTGAVPLAFTASTIVPLLKKGMDPDDLDSYRPLSLTTTVSKLLELLLLDELLITFKPEDLQFGFVKHRNSEHASLLATETIQWHLSRKTPTFAANLDARKCFDKIWHDGLFARLVDLLSPSSWLLLVHWYGRLTGRVMFNEILSQSVKIRRGTRQGAILSPTLANVFLAPLVSQLDKSGLGAYIHNCHVPAVCYADDLFVLATNKNNLQKILDIISVFADLWRLEFVHPHDNSLTKSHCIVFGPDLLTVTPTWSLSNQTLSTRSSSDHLGITHNAKLQGKLHALSRMKKARGSFFGLVPVGIFSKNLAPLEKAFLWRSVATPSLVFGCHVAPLNSSDIDLLESCQGSCLKACLHLPRYAHHTPLIRALNIPKVCNVIHNSYFKTLASSCRTNNRLQKMVVRGLALTALQPAMLRGSFLGMVTDMCGGSLSTMLEICNGRAYKDRSGDENEDCGITDSVRTALSFCEPVRSSILVMLLCNANC